MIYDKFYMFDNNIVSFFLLGILLLTIILKEDIYDYSRKLFYRMVIFNMVLLLVEVFAWAFDGIALEYAFILNYFFNCLLIIFEPIMAAMWVSYVDFKINGSIDRLKKRIYYLHSAILAGGLLIINFFTPVAFYLDSSNVYHRGPLLWLSLIYVFGLVLYSFILTIKNKNKLSEKMIRFIAIFAFLPVIVSLIQMFVYGLILTWSVVALGMVFAYYLMEITGSDKDYLTGLYSRQKIEEILRGKLEQKEDVTVIMIDLEAFKEINDEFGHKIGDETLLHFSQVLQAYFGKNNFVSRIGGDEFLVVIGQEEVKNFGDIRSELKVKLADYNDFEILKKLGISVGIKHFKYNDGLNYDLIFNVVDDLMYDDKSANKNQMRRRSDRNLK